MQDNADHIRTTHTGSLPRPDDLVDPLYAEESGETSEAHLFKDREALQLRIRETVAESVRGQVAAGLEIVNDGEMGKVSYSTYVTSRLTGYESRVHVPRAPRPDAAAFPGYAAWNAQQQRGSYAIRRYACTGPVRYVGQEALRRDIDNLKAALDSVDVAEGFMTAASPGVISLFQPSATQTPGKKPADLGLRLEALNHAVVNIPPQRMRLHLCWGNYEGPHHLDVPLADIIHDVLTARPAGLSFEAANPRHEHEWTVFEELKLPDGKVIIPGVLDTTTNYIEHPELVAQRLVRYARLVGRERVIGGADCGFGTFAGTPMVHPEIVFAKLESLVEGARIASRQLWP